MFENKGDKFFRKGYNFRNGYNGYNKDSIKAIQFFKKAWEATNYESLLQLSEMYYDGEGTERDIPLALNLLQTYIDFCPNITENKLSIGLDRLIYGYYYDTKEYEKFFQMVERKVKSRIDDKYNIDMFISAIANGIGTTQNIDKAIFLLNEEYRIYNDSSAKRRLEWLANGESIPRPEPINAWHPEEEQTTFPD